MSRSQRDKGLRAEREIVDRHKAINVHAERYPLSGGSRFRGSGHDVDLYPFGRDAAPLVAEVKRAGMVRLRQHVEHHVHVTAEQIGNLREHRRDTEPY